MKMNSVKILIPVLFFPVLSFLVACEDSNNSAGTQVQYCEQASAFMDKAENEGSLSPRDWGNLMLAGARLVYVDNECGDRINESPEKLCAALHNTMQVFVNNPMVPKGKNRDSAIQLNSDVYRRAECQPLLEND
jgi:hypothetical protein